MAQADKSERWKMYRAKFFNFWYYPDQEYHFENGCAVLRGHNGSGKSVTTQSLITVLLDGDTRSHKLDPFGGRERTLKDTLLGEENLLKIDERIGYMLMEFKKGSHDVYKTIGIGVEARRDRVSPKVWYFIIDGKQIGNEEHQLKLYKEEQIEGEMKKIPLDEKEFRQLVEQELHCGKVYVRREEYAEKVNKQLFGFDSQDSYKGLMDLLIQIRSPKLSDNSRPEGVVEVLNEALPQLTQEELRPLTTSIEAIDRIEKDLQTYKKDLKAINGLNNVYVEYNQISLTEKAAEFVKAHQHLENVKNQILEKEKIVQQTRSRLQELKQERTHLENQLDVFREEKASLGFEEIESISEKKSQAEIKRKQLEEKIEAAESKLKRAEQTQREYARRRDEYARECEQAEKELREYVTELVDIAKTLHYPEHERYFQHFEPRQDQEKYSFHAWKESVKKYEQFISETRRKLSEYDQMHRQLLQMEQALGELQQKIDHANNAIEQWQEESDLELSHLVENIQRWVEASQVLAVRRELIDALVQRLHEVFTTIDQETFLQPLTEWVAERRNSLQSEKLTCEHQINQLMQEMEHTLQEIEAWKSDKEVEPFFVENKRVDWEQLKQNNIPFTPFYEAFEFVEGIEENEQLRIQNALFEAGLLTSVVVSREHVAEAKKYTSVVEYKPANETNLTEVLTVSEDIQYEAILSGIPFAEQNEAYILGSGMFKNGFSEGKSARIIDTVYIGKAAREAYRQQKIAEFEAQYMSLLADKERLDKEHKSIEQKIVQLKQEHEQFPSLHNLKQLMTQIEQEEQKKQDIYEPERAAKLNDMERLHSQMQALMSEIKRGMDWTELELHSASFEKEERYVKDYMSCLSDLERAFMEKSHASQNMLNNKREYEQQEDVIHDYQDGLHDLESDKDRTEREITGYERMLKDLGSGDIIARMKELTEQINHVIPEQLSALDREDILLEQKEKDEQERTEQLSLMELPYRMSIRDAWEKAFSDHERAGFIELEDELSVPLDKAQAITTRFAEFIDKKREKMDQVKNRLNRRYNDLNMELFHYDPEMDTKAFEHLPDVDPEDESKLNQLNLMAQQMQRMVITLDVNGERVSPSYTAQQLERRIHDLEVEANEKDRDLYERILVNTLGETIRQKIHYVQRWETEMNKFMEHENLIKFRLKWVPKKSEKEEELHTQQLVDALKRDSQWIDLGEISSHFRSKIKEAKRKHDDQQDNILNLQQIMREVLDYRKWFDFEIYFTKKGDKEKRLTRRTYGELSGGQRVLAMITPVLAALYAKYSEAHDDCPRIFTLDEAFSRVDDDNINIMFDYIYKLDFNYILNSQSLWGCFESVPSLNIYELARPDNRPTVSVAAYYWNGKRKIRKTEQQGEGLHDEQYDLVT